MTERSAWDVAGRARVNDRWAECAVLWNKAMTEALLSAAALTPDSVVLDLAAGSGDPAFTIAERLVGGHVIALDSSHASISIASDRGDRPARHLPYPVIACIGDVKVAREIYGHSKR